ncbi:flagellar basal body P-ring formation chaperone FlgA [Rhodobacter capsulatus]|uniref:flagellar basal body P-ring formation chaperone FlgA n=1 Tax=Rhodobacter capsulatus TaxID=1061 RepID=UPI004024E0C3
MIRPALALVLCVLPALAEAGSVVAARTLRAQTVITEADLAISEDDVPGALSDPMAAIGLETRTAIYPQQPISAGDLAPPALIERNQMVQLAYRDGSLSILTEGRALDRGAVGDTIRVMNVTSKATLYALLGADGVAYVQPH